MRRHLSRYDDYLFRSLIIPEVAGFIMKLAKMNGTSGSYRERE